MQQQQQQQDFAEWWQLVLAGKHAAAAAGVLQAGWCQLVRRKQSAPSVAWLLTTPLGER
jgi:hypothetical protein